MRSIFLFDLRVCTVLYVHLPFVTHRPFNTQKNTLTDEDSPFFLTMKPKRVSRKSITVTNNGGAVRGQGERRSDIFRSREKKRKKHFGTCLLCTAQILHTNDDATYSTHSISRIKGERQNMRKDERGKERERKKKRKRGRGKCGRGRGEGARTAKRTPAHVQTNDIPPPQPSSAHV